MVIKLTWATKEHEEAYGRYKEISCPLKQLQLWQVSYSGIFALGPGFPKRGQHAWLRFLWYSHLKPFMESIHISAVSMGEWVLSSQTVFKDINNIGTFSSHQCSKQVTNDWQLEPPEHLDGIDNADIGVGKVIEATKGEGREHPHQAGIICNVANRPEKLRLF